MIYLTLTWSKSRMRFFIKMKTETFQFSWNKHLFSPLQYSLSSMELIFYLHFSGRAWVAGRFQPGKLEGAHVRYFFIHYCHFLNFLSPFWVRRIVLVSTYFLYQISVGHKSVVRSRISRAIGVEPDPLIQKFILKFKARLVNQLKLIKFLLGRNIGHNLPHPTKAARHNLIVDNNCRGGGGGGVGFTWENSIFVYGVNAGQRVIKPCLSGTKF